MKLLEDHSEMAFTVRIGPGDRNSRSLMDCSHGDRHLPLGRQHPAERIGVIGPTRMQLRPRRLSVLNAMG